MAAPRALLLVRNPFTHDARVLRAAGALRRRGYEPLVVAVMSTEVRQPHEVKEGVTVVRLDPISPFSLLQRRRRSLGGASTAAAASPAAPGVPGPVVRLHRLLRTLDFYRRAIRVVRRERPALVHCNDYNTMWVGLAARAMGSVVVYDSHELWPDRNLRPEPRWWLLLCESLFVRMAHVVVASSAGHAEVMARRYRVESPAVVRNVPAGPRPEQATPALEPDLAVYAGGLAPHRGLEQLIRALALVPDLRVRLVGPGHSEYVQRLREHARDIGVAERLETPGPVQPRDVVDAVRPAAFGVALFQPTCLSHRLVAPNKVFEYLAAGLPSLVSDLPVLARFVAETGAGVAVPPGDVAAIADGARVLADPGRNLGWREAAVRAARETTWARERETLDAAYARAEAAAR